MSNIDRDMVRTMVQESIETNINENVFSNLSNSVTQLGVNIGVLKPVVSIGGLQFPIPAWLFSLTSTSFMGIPGAVLFSAGVGISALLLDVLLDVMKDRKMRDRYPDYDSVVRELKLIRQEKISDSEELVKRIAGVLASIRGFLEKIENDQTIGFFERRRVIKKMHDVYNKIDMRYGRRVMQQASVAAT